MVSYEKKNNGRPDGQWQPLVGTQRAKLLRAAIQCVVSCSAEKLRQAGIHCPENATVLYRTTRVESKASAAPTAAR